jgi:hypothetical protein
LFRQRGAIEELDAGEDDALRTGCGFQIDDHVQQVGTDFILGDFVGRFLVEIGQFPNRSHVAVDRSLGQTGQPEVLDLFLILFPFEEL